MTVVMMSPDYVSRHRMASVELRSELPIVQAPMAGGPSTVALALAAARAGAYPFVAAGYLSAAALADQLDEFARASNAPLGVNLFVPSAPSEPAPIAAYAGRLAAEAARLGAPLGEPRWHDDDYPAKLDLLGARPVDLVTFTFGCPDPADVQRLHRSGARVGVTVTSAAEARQSADNGADLLVVQGTEAGGHQATFVDDDGPNETPLLAALASVRAAVDLPLIAAGGIGSPEDLRAALAAGAGAGQVGTALLCADEAGTAAVHRRALLEHRYQQTVLTRAFSGRHARGLRNRFAAEHSATAPRGYPEVHYLTRPLRQAATKAGDPDVPNLWAGLRWGQVRAAPAAEIVRELAGN
jgi:nitronate monooxygenase